MRLKRVSIYRLPNGNRTAFVQFTQDGVVADLSLNLPAEWDVWTRAQKVAWGRQQITDHLLTHRYMPGGEVVYPDQAATEQAANDFDALPGWATWTAAEAAAWIDVNVTSLATAKVALQAMAKAIVYLRNAEIER